MVEEKKKREEKKKMCSLVIKHYKPSTATPDERECKYKIKAIINCETLNDKFLLSQFSAHILKLYKNFNLIILLFVSINYPSTIQTLYIYVQFKNYLHYVLFNICFMIIGNH